MVVKNWIKVLCGLVLISPVVAAMPPHHWHKTHLPSKNSLRGSAVFGQSLWVSGSDNGVFRSTDKGQSWQNISVKSEQITDFRDIELFSDKEAIVMGVGTGKPSVLYHTKDAGRTWRELFANPEPEGFFDSIGFWDRQKGLLLGDPVDGYYAIYRTKDGGKSFTRIAKSKIPPLLKDEAAFAASGNTLIVGKNGKTWFTTGGKAAHVYLSEDFGESWQRETVPLHNKTATSGGYSLALNSQQQLFVLGGDYQQSKDQYVHIATRHNEQWKIPAGDVKSGLRTAMSCVNKLCLSTGRTFTGISNNDGASWQLFAFEGYYTLSAGSGLFLAAGNDGRIGVLSFK